MNKFKSQGINILIILFSNIRKRVSLFVSLILTLVLSGALISSFFLSDLTLKNLAQSNYFQSKVTQVLAGNEIASKGHVSIKFNSYRSADVTIEKANLSSFSNILAHNINLKVDFIKYWLGLSFIEEVFIKEVTYSLPIDLSLNLNDLNSIDLKFLTQSINASLNKINSKSIYIEKGTLKFQTQLYEFNQINLLKNETLLTAKASLNAKKNADEMTNYANVNLSLNDANIIKFNIDFYMHDYNWK